MPPISTKKTAAAQRIARSIAVFACPLCAQSMTLHEHAALVCRAGHSFDLARTGYINLLAGAPNAQYERTLFTHRRTVCRAGFFNPMLEAAATLIGTHAPQAHTLHLLDAGCGEGSQTARLHQRLSHTRTLCTMGVDIAKSGIQLAAAQDAPLIWCVGDLARLPVADGCMDALVSILSPANYTQFLRVLRPGGVVVKVFPGAAYLQQIRVWAGQGADGYSNERMTAHFARHLRVLAQRTLRYDHPADETLLRAFIGMTPLSWHADPADAPPDVPHVTADFTLLVGTHP